MKPRKPSAAAGRKVRPRSPRKKAPGAFRLNSSIPAYEEDFEEYEDEAWSIPSRWVKAVAAVFLLPATWLVAQTVFAIFGHATMHNHFWATEEFWFFGLGTVLWLITFFGLPRPVMVYVFGHELTHAIWVWLMGGRVSRFHVSSEGGQIVTDKSNFLIALAPYFFPIYSIGVIACWGLTGLFVEIEAYRRLFFALIGITWGFHFTFTCWMIPKGQSDLTEHGTFFSLVVIFLMNCLVLSALLVAASPDVTWVAFGRELLANAMDFSALVVEFVQRCSAKLPF